MGVYTGKPPTKNQADIPLQNRPDVQDGGKSATAGLGALTTGFLSSTSAHGLPRVVSEPSLIRKLAWLVIFVGATALFCLMMYYAFVEYFDKPVEINMKYKVRMEAEFPAVTVCNLNPLKKSKLAGSNFQSLKDIDDRFALALMSSGAAPAPGMGGESGESDRSATGGSSVSATENPTQNQRRTELQAAISAQKSQTDFQVSNSDFMTNAASDTDFESFMEYSKTDDYSDITDLLKPTKGCLDRYGHQAKDFILQCSFDKTNCSYLDFTTVYNSRYGNCFVFNLNATTTTLYGSKYGLRLTLNVEPDDYLGLFSHEVGVRVAVHAANITAFPEDEGINAPSEFSTSIGVTTSTFTRLPYPYASMCADGSNHTLLDNNEYTVWACSLACLQSNLKTDCGCSDMVGLPSTETKCSLTNATQEVCRQKIYDLYNKGQLGCYCPLPCNQVQYNSKVSMTSWPSRSYIPILWDSLGDKLADLGYSSVGEAKNSMARVHVYMEHLTIHATDEYAAFTLEDLFASMGGYLGLFIGISVCTVMEFFEFLIDAFGYAAITMCGGSFVRCFQQKSKKSALPVNSTPIQTVKLPPPELMQNSKTNKKPKILRVQPVSDANEIALGFNPQAPTRW